MFIAKQKAAEDGRGEAEHNWGGGKQGRGPGDLPPGGTVRRGASVEQSSRRRSISTRAGIYSGAGSNAISGASTVPVTPGRAAGNLQGASSQQSSSGAVLAPML